MSVGGDSYVACLSDWRSVLRLVALSGSPEFPDTGDPDSCLRMLISRVDFSNVGRNCAMDFSARKMCPRARMPEFDLRMFAQTLPALPVRQEWPVREVLAGAEGFSGAGEIAGAEGFAGAEDWGYIRQVADGESPFCV